MNFKSLLDILKGPVEQTSTPLPTPKEPELPTKLIYDPPKPVAPNYLWPESYNYDHTAIAALANSGAMTAEEIRTQYMQIPVPAEECTWEGHRVPGNEWKTVDIIWWALRTVPGFSHGELEFHIDSKAADVYYSNMRKQDPNVTRLPLFFLLDARSVSSQVKLFVTMDSIETIGSEISVNLNQSVYKFKVKVQQVPHQVLRDFKTGLSISPPVHFEERGPYDFNRDDERELAVRFNGPAVPAIQPAVFTPASVDDPDTDDVDLSGEFE